MNILTMQGLSTDQVINKLGGLGVVAQHTKLQQDIETLLLTRYGSVIGNPTYGSHLYELLFDKADTATLNSAKLEVERVLYTHYNFINNVSVSMKVEDHQLNISVNYTTLNTNLSTKLEFRIPLNVEGGISYE